MGMETIEQTLKRHIEASGDTLYRIGKDSGVNYSSLYRFVAGERQLSLEVAQKLATYFNLSLTQRRRTK